jgi:serine/threonine-protein kinase
VIGQTLAHYEVLEKLGQGGMGAVYRARDTKLGREVALKLLPEDFANDPERLARFRREAKVLASLNHPNVASIHGLEESDGRVFLIMELAAGEDLAHRFARGPLSVDEIVGVARQMAEGLEQAHERGVVHRDLKPANVMMSDEGAIKILDFGLARAYAGESPAEGSMESSPTITAAMTQVGTILGTAAYMSPEQARGREVDRRADIWAFGVILYEGLTGTRLFEGESISDTLAGVLKTEPDFDALPDETPVALRWLIERCLQKQPSSRLRDIGEARILLPWSWRGAPGGSFRPSSSSRWWRRSRACWEPALLRDPPNLFPWSTQRCYRRPTIRFSMAREGTCPCPPTVRGSPSWPATVWMSPACGSVVSTARRPSR